MKMKFINKKICKKILKHVARWTAVFLAFVSILIFILLFRLSQGPIEIQGLTPIIQQALHVKEMGLTLDIQKVYLQQGIGKGRLVDIALSDMRLTKADNTEMLVVPEASIAFQFLPLFKGDFVPSFLSLSSPELNMTLVTETAEQAEEPTTQTYLSQANNIVAQTKDLLGRLHYVEHLSMQDATIRLHVDQQEWLSLKEVNADVVNLRGPNIGLHTTFQVHHQQQELPLDIKAKYNWHTQELSAIVAFQEVNLAQLFPQIELFSGFHFTFKGQVQGQVDLAKTVTCPRQWLSALSFDMESTKAGDLFLPAPIATTYPVESVQIKGHASPEVKELFVDEALLSLGKPSAIAQVEVTGTDRFLDAGDLSAIKTALKATVKDMPMAQVPEVWPSTIGPDAHSWVKENLTGGTVPTADFQLDFAGVDITKIYGAVQVQGTRVRFLEGMSPVEDVNGIVYLGMDDVKIDVTKGHIGSVQLTSADLKFLELDKDISRTEMSLNVEGPLRNILQIADEEPLALVRDFGIAPDTIQGNAKVNIFLAFPFLDDLSAKDIKVKVVGDVTEGYFPEPELSTDLTNATFHAEITNDKLLAKGQAKIENSVLDMEWEERFEKNKDFQTRYALKGDVDVSILKLASADVPSVWKGTAFIDMKMTEDFAGVTQIQVEADLTKAQILFFPLSYTKEQGKVGKATAKIRMGKDVVLEQLQITVPADQVKIEGTGSFGKNIKIDLPTIKAPNNDFSLAFAKDKKLEVTVRGQSWDATQALHMPFETSSSADSSDSSLDWLKNMVLSVDLEKLFTDKKPFHRVKFDIGLNKGKFSVAEGRALAAAPVEITLNKGTMYIVNDDVGDLLERLGYTNRIQNGVLRFQLTPDEKGGFEGNMVAKNFEVAETSFLMQSLTILGIVDAIQGNNLSFDEGNFPFVLEASGAVTLTDGVAYGTAVGITLNGTLKGGALDFKGSVIPAYAINSLPGKVPLIGRLFSGDKGGGLVGVAFSITGKSSDPQVEFAPSSLLTPGIFRNLFN